MLPDFVAIVPLCLIILPAPELPFQHNNRSYRIRDEQFSVVYNVNRVPV